MTRHLFTVIAACVALSCVPAAAEDMDLRALQQQIARQQAQLNELRARVERQGYAAPADAGAADGVTSLRKNAVVTLGGTVNTRYHYRQGKVESRLVNAGLGNFVDTGDKRKREDFKHGDFGIADAKLEARIDVNDHFDAHIKLDFHDGVSRHNVSGIAQNYWIRWKNVCNTGFGVLVGRDSLKFGDEQPIGILDTWNKDAGSTIGAITGNSVYADAAGTRGAGLFANGSLLPGHTTYNWTRTTQINPYWESGDGGLRVDVSLLQAVDTMNGITSSHRDNRGGYAKYRSINYGLGTMTGRVQWRPIEGLKLTGSVMNLYARRPGLLWYTSAAGVVTDYGVNARHSSSNPSINLAVQYRPRFLPRLNVWAQWTHGWNEGWVKDMDADSINYGASYDLTESWTLFAQGDWLRTKNDNSDLWNKGSGWAFYTGAVFTLPYGVNFEAGWRHEQINYKGRTLGRHTKYTGNTIYAHLGFNF